MPSDALGLGRLDRWISQTARNPWGLVCLSGQVRAQGQELERRFEAAAAWRDTEGIDTRFDVEVDPLLERLERGGLLDLDELRSLSLLVQLLEELKRVGSDALSSISDLTSTLGDYDELARRLVSAIGEDGELRDEASEKLGSLRRSANHARQALSQNAEQIVDALDRQGILQDRFVTQRRDRPVVPVRAGMQNRMEGRVRDTSRSGATAFVEPAVLADAQQRVAQTQEALAEELDRIVRQLCELLAKRAKDILADLSVLGQLEADRVRGEFAKCFGGVRPTFREGQLAADGLLPAQLLVEGIEDPVPSNFRIGAKRSLLVVSGPNGGGKSVLLTSIGWAYDLAQRGFLIPAAKVTMPPPPYEIRAVIGDPSHLQAGASTFQLHLRSLVQLLRQSADLVLVDELCSGTEPVAGSALACAIAESLSEQSGFQVVTTHYDPLKSLGTTHPAMSTAAFFDPGQADAFQLQQNEISTADPLATALSEGLPDLVVESARSYLDRGRNQRLDQLQDLERQGELLQRRIQDANETEADLERRKQALNQREAGLEKREHLASEKEQKAKRRREDQREAVVRAGLKRLDGLQAELRDAVRSLREDPRLAPDLRRQGEALFTDVGELRDRYSQAVEPPPRPRREGGSPPAVGERVKVLRTGAKGRLERVKGTRAWVSLGALDLELDLDELVKIDDLA